MPYNTCAIADCAGVTYIQWDCVFCGVWHCRAHNTREHHNCLDKPLGEVVNGFITAMTTDEGVGLEDHSLARKAKLAIDLKEKVNRDFPGYALDIPPAKEILGCGTNIHIPVTDSQGVKWLARTRYRNFDSDEDNQKCTQVEVATMRFLQATDAKVPRVLIPSQSQDYFLIEFMQGKPSSAPVDLENFSVAQRKLLFRDFASHYIALSSMPARGIGSLHLDPDSGDFRVGSPLAQNTDKPDRQIFNTNLERYLAKIEGTLLLLHKETDVTRKVIEMYLSHLEIREIILTCEELRREDQEHYVLHGEGKGDHFLLKDGRLTAVIDWEWSELTTKEEAFAGATAFWDLSLFFDGSNALSKAERLLIDAYLDLGRPDMAECVKNGKKYQRLMQSVGVPPELPMLQGLQDAVGVKVDQQETMAEWRKMAEKRYDGDDGLASLLARLDKATTSA